MTRPASRAARLAHSERLQRVHELLRDGLERSTLEIAIGARCCAVNSVIHELRINGADIPPARQTVSHRGERVWLYRMVAPVPEQETSP